MLCADGKLSLAVYLLSSLLTVIPELILRLELHVYILPAYLPPSIWFLHFFQFAFLNLLVFLSLRGFAYQVAVRSAFLGYVFGIGTTIYVFFPPSWQMFGVYISVLTFFHFSEFLAIAWTNPRAVSINNFILNHSLAYGIAACSSWLEFLVERQFFPEMKMPSSISYFGLVLCVMGEILRKLAMITARHNFNHVVQDRKSKDHVLVTHGVYKLCRHPSYVGWFYWSIGTQLILQNPFCFLAYAVTSWRFFNDRIRIEEITLLNFFGQDYVEYQKNVGTGLPFIDGYKIHS